MIVNVYAPNTAWNEQLYGELYHRTYLCTAAIFSIGTGMWWSTLGTSSVRPVMSSIRPNSLVSRYSKHSYKWTTFSTTTRTSSSLGTEDKLVLNKSLVILIEFTASPMGLVSKMHTSKLIES